MSGSPERSRGVLRPATEADVDLIRKWRNHPRVRAVSMTTGEITAEGHAKWWAAVSADPTRHVLIFEYAGTPAGVVNFADVAPGGAAEWGFFLDLDGLEPGGELLPAWLELEGAAVAYGFDTLGLAVLGGRTLGWNTQVLALHRRFGFVEVPEKSYVTTIDGVQREVVWTEMDAARYHARNKARLG